MAKKLKMISEPTRRDFIKAGVAASAATAMGFQVPGVAMAQDPGAGLRWGKGVCRFCGVGCGIQIGTKGERVVAVKGDENSPVNRGLLCAKGYANAGILYGDDRLTQPLMRMKNGQYDKEGEFATVSWERAFDEMERQFKAVYNDLGPTGVAIMGSGQYTIQEGYGAVKLLKAGWRSNNIDPNARHCMASAVAAFIQTYGIDEPAGCYEDIELTDTIVTWGSNMAECHPMLWARVSEKRRTDPNYRVINLTTISNRTSDVADEEILFKPNTDLAIWNYIAREIVKRGKVDKEFVKKYCVFATGPYDIGYGMRDTDKHAFPAEKDTQARENLVILTADEAIAQRRKPQDGLEVPQKMAKNAGAHWTISYNNFREGLEPYTLDFVAQLSRGDSEEPLDAYKAKLKKLADYYADPKRKIVSFWTMGFNQHTRGTWVNEQAYMVHLLTGKQAKPGNGGFSLTGQPSACGTAREVGTFAHRLPADMVVMNPKHRARAEKIWKLPPNTINPKVGSHITQMMRDLESGTLKWLWVQVTNPFQSTANANHWIRAGRDKDKFIVVSDVYPTLSCKMADLILPSAMIFEKWGAYGNSERRTQLWREQVAPPGDARSDLWQTMEFSKRFTLKECWGEKKIPGLKAAGFTDGQLPDVLPAAQAMGYTPETTLYEVLFATEEAKKTPWPQPVADGHENHTVIHAEIDWFPEKSLFDEYVQFGKGHMHDLADFDTYYSDIGVQGLMWPVVNGKETPWRFNAKYDPYVKDGNAMEFYGPALKAIPKGNLDGVTDPKKIPAPGKAKIFFRPYAAPPEIPDKDYDLWLSTGRVVEHWHTGSMTQRIPELHNAVPIALVYMSPKDAAKRGVQENGLVWVESRRGKVKSRVALDGRNRVPPGMVFVPFFDTGVFINKVTLDATDPISKETDFKKCAVKVYKA